MSAVRQRRFRFLLCQFFRRLQCLMIRCTILSTKIHLDADIYGNADVIAVLTESAGPAAYWRKLKQRLKAEGNETVTNCHALKMRAADGKNRLTDVADTEQLLRIIQSIPSKKAEPFKAWLAMVGRERIEETIDPEQAIDRALETYLKKGYSEEWVHQRLLAIRIRNELTDEWKSAACRKAKNTPFSRTRSPAHGLA